MKKNTLLWLAGGLGGCLLLAVVAAIAINFFRGRNPQVVSPGKPPAAFQAPGVTPSTPTSPAENSSQQASPTATFASQTASDLPLAAAVNLTSNREGGYNHPSLLFDSQGSLHLVYYSSLPRSGDYFHQELSPGGAWTSPESLTADFDILWSDLELKRHPQGNVCVLWAGVTAVRLEAYFKRCQDGAGGVFSPVEVWQEHTFDTRAGFSPLLLPDGKVQAAFDRVGGGITFGDLELTGGTDPDHSSLLVQDASGGYHLVWFRQGDPYSLQYRHSADGGAEWSPAENLTTLADQPDAWYDLQADTQGHLHLVWPGFSGGLYYRRWTSAGGWGETISIASRGCPAKIAVNADGLARVAIGCWDGVFLFRQQPDGSWQPPQQVSAAGGALDIAVDGNDTAHLVYLAENDLYYVAIEGSEIAP